MTHSSTFDGPFLAIPRWARQRITNAHKGAALHVLCALVEHMNIRTKYTTISTAMLAEEAGLSKETTKRMVRWMSEEGIISISRDSSGTNKYQIVYKQVGSPMTLGGVTHDPSGGSPMTLGGVTHDPSKTPKNDLLAGKTQNTIEVVIESINKEDIEIACGDEKGTCNMILGEDPSERKEPMTTTSKTTKNPDVRNLSLYFLHNKAIVMRIHNHTDQAIVRRTCRLLLDSGVKPETIRKMMDRFFSDTRFMAYDNPVMTFASKKIQKVLMDSITVVITVDDPILMLMAQDFIREDLILPWDLSADKTIRNSVTTRCLETLYRYPELVAIIIQKWTNDFNNSKFLEALSAIESLVKHGLGKETVNISELLDVLSFMPLPKDLINGTLRPAAGTMVSAIYEYRRANHV